MADIINLDQVRAKNAFKACSVGKFSGANNGEVVKKLPPMIRENGMLGALAFAMSKKDKEVIGYANAFEVITQHLYYIGKITSSNAETLQKELLECNSLKLRDVTVETMLYLDYLRRFAKKNEEQNK